MHMKALMWERTEVKDVGQISIYYYLSSDFALATYYLSPYRPQWHKLRQDSYSSTARRHDGAGNYKIFSLRASRLLSLTTFANRAFRRYLLYWSKARPPSEWSWSLHAFSFLLCRNWKPVWECKGFIWSPYLEGMRITRTIKRTLEGSRIVYFQRNVKEP